MSTLKFLKCTITRDKRYSNLHFTRVPNLDAGILEAAIGAIYLVIPRDM